MADRTSCRSSWSPPTASCGRARPPWSSPAPPRATSASCRTTRRSCRCWSTASSTCTTAEGETWVAAVDAGFLSVANNRVSILAEHAEMSHDIDLEKARQDLERAKAAGENDDEAAGGGPAGRGPDPGGREGVLIRARCDSQFNDSPSRVCHFVPRAGEGTDAAVAVGRRRGRRAAASSSCSTASLWSSAVACCPATAGPSSSATASGPTGTGRGWLLGIGRYSGDQLEWFRIFSLSPRPKRSWPRGDAGLRRPARAGGRRADVAVRRPRGGDLLDARR